MPSRLNHIALELAPETAHPFGTPEIRYDVYLPLNRNGTLDAEALPEAGCRVRQRISGVVMHGKISAVAGERLVFSYSNGATQECGCEHLLEGMPLRAGQRLSICDAAGTPHPFEVISIRET